MHSNNRRSQRYHEYAGKDEKDQWEKQFDPGFGRRFFGRLRAACAKRVCKLPERVCNGCAEALRLHQHSDKLPHKININPLRHAAPGVETRLSGALFAIDDLELVGQRGRQAGRGGCSPAGEKSNS